VVADAARALVPSFVLSPEAEPEPEADPECLSSAASTTWSCRRGAKPLLAASTRPYIT